MNRPYIICHMVSSIDGRVTGDFLFRPECEKTTEVYYEINRQLKANGYICGRVTMEGSFTNGWYPDLSEYEINVDKDDYIDNEPSGFYAVAFDPKGKLGWKNNCIIDDDPGYGGARIIEVLTEQVDPRYLSYLRTMKIPYIFAGVDEIDVDAALLKLKKYFGTDKLLLEGGSIVNGYFERADMIDELSVVIAPTVADDKSKPFFSKSVISDFELIDIKKYDGSIVKIGYRRLK